MTDTPFKDYEKHIVSTRFLQSLMRNKIVDLDAQNRALMLLWLDGKELVGVPAVISSPVGFAVCEIMGVDTDCAQVVFLKRVDVVDPYSAITSITVDLVKEALEFYADANSYVEKRFSSLNPYHTDVGVDAGARARTALSAVRLDGRNDK